MFHSSTGKANGAPVDSKIISCIFNPGLCLQWNGRSRALLLSDFRRISQRTHADDGGGLYFSWFASYSEDFILSYRRRYSIISKTETVKYG